LSPLLSPPPKFHKLGDSNYVNMKINFFLKEPNSDKNTIIYIVYRNSKAKIKFKATIGEKIHPDHWDKKKQRMRKREGLPHINFNRSLDLKEQEFRDLVYKLTATKKLTQGKLESEYKQISVIVKQISILEYLDNLCIKDDLKAYEKTKVFGSLKNMLTRFHNQTGYKIDFDAISDDFISDFIEFMKQANQTRKGHEHEKYSANYIAKMIGTLSRVMTYARKEHLTDNPVKVNDAGMEEDVYKVFLTEPEIEKLINADLPPYLRNAVDLFIVGCYTGMRVGNYLNIDPDVQIDQESGFITAIVNKNGPRVKIPIHPKVREILNRYKGMPKQISEKNLNEFIKEAGKRAGINQKILWVRTEGGKRVEHVNEKWEMIETHTARRSFANNAKRAGIPDEQIMKITGHKTRRAFYTYIKTTQEEVAETLANHPFFK
jgi:site-specific recombinase XerD